MQSEAIGQTQKIGPEAHLNIERVHNTDKVSRDK